MSHFEEAFVTAIKMIVTLDPYLIQVTTTSMKVSFTAIAIAAVLGISLGAFLGTRNFIGKKLFIKLIYSFMGLPPVFVGLIVYLLLSRQGVIAQYIYLLWTPAAMIIAQVILATPIIAGYTTTAIEEKYREVVMTTKGLGARTIEAIWMTVREAKVGIIVAIAAAFGRVIAEVGAVTIVGGDILGKTRVLTTAIIIETRQGRFGTAMAFGLILIFLSFLVNNIVYFVQKR